MVDTNIVTHRVQLTNAVDGLEYVCGDDLMTHRWAQSTRLGLDMLIIIVIHTDSIICT